MTVETEISFDKLQEEFESLFGLVSIIKRRVQDEYRNNKPDLDFSIVGIVAAHIKKLEFQIVLYSTKQLDEQEAAKVKFLQGELHKLLTSWDEVLKQASDCQKKRLKHIKLFPWRNFFSGFEFNFTIGVFVGAMLTICIVRYLF